MLDDAALAEIVSTPVPDDFFVEHLSSSVAANDYSQRALQRVCDDFVQVFLSEGDWIASLHQSLHQCDGVLNGIEGVLETFIVQIKQIQRDMGKVYDESLSTTVQLGNARAAEKVLWHAVSHLVVPPEVVQVITQSSEEELGSQFAEALKVLYAFLKYRRGGWAQRGAEAAGATSSSTATMSASDRSSSVIMTGDGPRPTLSRSLNSCQSPGERGSSQQPQGRGDAVEQGAHQALMAGSTRSDSSLPQNSVQIRLGDCRLYMEQLGLLRNLTVCASYKIKQFLSKKLQVLSKPSTNIAIQQENVLAPYSFLVHFLKNAGLLLAQAQHQVKLSLRAAKTKSGQVASDKTSRSGDKTTGAVAVERVTTSQEGRESAGMAAMSIHIVRVLYRELRSQYTQTIAQVYKQKVERYLFVCNSLELHQVASPGSNALPLMHYALPLLVEPRTLPPSAFRIGARSRLFEGMFAPPLVPAVEIARERKHFYEETYRSLNCLLCDIVTHEYLFNFEFFSADMSVYIEAFEPTMQLVVDYVSEIMLQGTAASSLCKRMTEAYGKARPNAYCRSDCYGLLMLIRITHDYRTMMKRQRQLSCLEGFYDSVLLLLWLAFQRTLDAQLRALKNVDIKQQMTAMSQLGAVEHQAAYVHHITKRYADFAAVLMGIAGTAVTQLPTGGAIPQGSVRSSSVSGSSTRGAEPEPTAPDRAALGRSYQSVRTDFTVDDPCAERHGSRCQWRRQALAMLDAAVECDAASHASRFSVLMTNLSFMRVEVQRIIATIGEELVPPQMRGTSRHLSFAFIFNNLHHILRVWDETSEFGTEVALALAQTDDFKALAAALHDARSEFIEALLTFTFPQLVGEINTSSEPVLADVERVAEGFLRDWKTGLDAAHHLIVRVFCDPMNHNDILARMCMELLLFNTRLHARIGRALESPAAQRPLRSLVVTNQQLLQHMRTFAAVGRDLHPEL